MITKFIYQVQPSLKKKITSNKLYFHRITIELQRITIELQSNYNELQRITTNYNRITIELQSNYYRITIELP
jgi:hypothetical protein